MDVAGSAEARGRGLRLNRVDGRGSRQHAPLQTHPGNLSHITYSIIEGDTYTTQARTNMRHCSAKSSHASARNDTAHEHARSMRQHAKARHLCVRAHATCNIVAAGRNREHASLRHEVWISHRARQRVLSRHARRTADGVCSVCQSFVHVVWFVSLSCMLYLVSYACISHGMA